MLGGILVVVFVCVGGGGGGGGCGRALDYVYFRFDKETN